MKKKDISNSEGKVNLGKIRLDDYPYGDLNIKFYHKEFDAVDENYRINKDSNEITVPLKRKYYLLETSEDNKLTLGKKQIIEAPKNLLQRNYGNNDYLDTGQMSSRHSSTTWAPIGNTCSVITLDGEKCYRFVQMINSSAENIWLWNYVNAFQNNRTANTGWVSPAIMKIVGDSSENGSYTLSAKIKYPLGKSGKLSFYAMNKERTTSMGGKGVDFVGTGDWENISVSITMTTENPYAYIQVGTLEALNNEPFYIKNLMVQKGTGTKYVPSYLVDGGYKYPNASKIYSNNGIGLSNVNNIINQSLSPYATLGAHTGSGGVTTGKVSNDIYFRFGLGVPAGANIKQVNYNIVMKPNRNDSIRLSEYIGIIKYDENSKCMSRYVHDPTWAGWDNVFRTDIDAQQRNYVWRDIETSCVQRFVNSNNHGFNLQFRNHNASATTSATVYSLRAKAFYENPVTNWESYNMTLEYFNKELDFNNFDYEEERDYVEIGSEDSLSNLINHKYVSSYVTYNSPLVEEYYYGLIFNEDNSHYKLRFSSHTTISLIDIDFNEEILVVGRNTELLLDDIMAICPDFNPIISDVEQPEAREGVFSIKTKTPIPSLKYPISIENSSNISESYILFYDLDNNLIGALGDSNIIYKLLEYEKFTVFLKYISNNHDFPDKLIEFKQTIPQTLKVSKDINMEVINDD